MINDEKEKRSGSPSTRTIIMVFAGSALFAGAILFPVLYFLLKPEPAIPYYLQGNPEGVRELSQPRAVSDFTLPATTGDDLSLSELRGQHLLVFFGYTHCPDICMLTLAEVRRVHELLGDTARDLQVVFISVDPARDDPERLREFFVPFGVQDYTIGMTGDDVTLQRITPDYSLYYQRHEDEGDNYSVDHTASLYYITPTGELDTIFSYGTRPEIIADHLQEQLG
ncbi:MAG: SCO family protein [Anaerolineae bacterium]